MTDISTSGLGFLPLLLECMLRFLSKQSDKYLTNNDIILKFWDEGLSLSFCGFWEIVHHGLWKEISSPYIMSPFYIKIKKQKQKQNKQQKKTQLE